MYGDKWTSGTSHSIIVNVVVIPLYRFAGGGALRHLAAAQWSTSRPLSPRWRCARRRPLPMFFAVQLAASGAADGCSRRARNTAATAVGGAHAARRYGGRRNDRVGNLLGTIHLDRRCGLRRVPQPQSCIFVRIPFRRSILACARPRPV